MGKITDTASGECWGADKLHQEMLKRSSYYYNSGIVAGDKVIIMHGNSAVFFVDLFALWNMGVCVVCLDSSTGFMELSSISDDLKAKAIIYRGSLSHEFVDAVCETMWINSDNVDAVADIAAIGELSLDDDALIYSLYIRLYRVTKRSSPLFAYFISEVDNIEKLCSVRYV